MIALSDIKSSINQLLKTKFGYNIYGREVQKGFSRPSFFVEILPAGSDNETQNFTSNKVTVIITYFQVMDQGRGYSDLDNIKMFDSLKGALGQSIKVSDRCLHPQNIHASYTGENLDILQVYFDIDYLDGTGRQRDIEQTATTIVVNMKGA